MTIQLPLQKTRLYTFVGLVLACFMLTSSPVIGADGSYLPIPNQNISISYASSTYTRKTDLTNKTSQSALGFQVGYQLFLGEVLALDGRFAMNLGAEQEVALMGGGAGLMWFLSGGSVREYKDAFINHKAIPSYNLWLASGIGFYSFDFTLEDEKKSQDESEGTTFTVKDPKDKSTGSVSGVYFELGNNFPLSKNLIPGLSFYIFQSFESQTSPSIDSTGINLIFSYILK